MAPRYRTTPSKNKWWGNAYVFNENITVKYELQWNSKTLFPGDEIRIKSQRGKVFKFRCIAHHLLRDSTWVDCLDKDGQFRSFPIEDLAGPVPIKKVSRRRKEK
jgi:hypothetical protein